MKVAVLGSGNGACAMAFEWARAGHDVYMFDFPQFTRQIDFINEAGGIRCVGEMEGFQPLKYAGHDIETCLKDAKLIFAVGPAYSTEAFGKACRPYAVAGQIYVVCPSSCMGAVVFKNALGLQLNDDSIIVADTSTLPYAVRIGDGAVEIFNRLKNGYKLATLPSSKNDMVYALLQPVHDGLEKASNVFETCLQNSNPVIHPSVTTLNVARLENPGDFFFYEEGVAPGVGRLMKAVDDERIAIGKKLGLTIEDDPTLGLRQGYMYDTSYDKGYSLAPGFKGIKAQTQLDYRYYNEDVGYTMVFWLSLAEKLGVEVPNMRAIVRVASTIMDRDYLAEGARTMTTIGLDGYTAEELCSLL